MKERLKEAFGKEFICSIELFPQLSAEDIREIYELGLTTIHAVYNSWEEIAQEHLERGDCDEYIRPFVNIEALAEHIKSTEAKGWTKLSSGKLIIAK